MQKITTSGRKFIDADGRQRIFNGINLCDKGYNPSEDERRIYEVDFSEELISKLSKMGFDPGMSSRKKTFLLKAMLKYRVDSSFPRITPASFIGGVMPIKVTKFTYTVDLSGMAAETML